MPRETEYRHPDRLGDPNLRGANPERRYGGQSRKARSGGKKKKNL